MHETNWLAHYICDMDDSILTEERMQDIRYKLLDWFGCSVGAAQSKTAEKFLKSFSFEKGLGESTVFCCKENFPLLAASFINGAESHILECDDVHKSAIAHPGIIAVLSSLMVCEVFNKSFKNFALGTTAGYEVIIRLGNALNPSHYDYWHTTGTCGTFAAAAATGKILGISATEMEQAFGIAATMASGLTCVFGTDSKLVTVGNAIRNGIQAVLMSHQGISSCHGVLEKPFGYAEATSANPNLSAITIEEAVPMIDTACYKLYASCGHTHSALDATFDLMSNYSITEKNVESVEIRTYSKAAELVGSFKNNSPSAAKFSLPYCIAAAIIDRSVSVSQFAENRLSDSHIKDLASKVTVFAEPQYDKFYPVKRIESVTIILKDGQKLEKTVILPLGHPAYSFIEEKFTALATLTVSNKTAKEMKDIILNVQNDTLMKNICKQLKGLISNGLLHD